MRGGAAEFLGVSGARYFSEVLMRVCGWTSWIFLGARMRLAFLKFLVPRFGSLHMTRQVSPL